MSNFETKEQYLNFISAWKSATNAEECKSKRVVCDHVQYNWDGFSDEEKAALEAKGYKVNRHSYTVPNGGHRKEPGWMDAAHYVFHNVMRGKDPKRGFSPKSKRKLEHNETPWHAFERAAWELEMVVKSAEKYVDELGQGKTPCAGTRATNFLKPFNGQLVIADLLKVDKEALANARKFHR